MRAAVRLTAVAVPGLVASLLCLAAALLTGCGGGSTSTQSAGATTTTTVSSTTSPGSSSTSSASSRSSTATTHSSSAAASQTQSTSASATTSSHSASSPKGGKAAAKSPKQVLGGVVVSSAAFPRGGGIPARFTCEGGNVSPPMQWSKVPAGTAQMFLIALSLNKGTGGAVRWAVGGIDPSSGGFGAGQLPAGAVVGRNSEGHISWAGACPAKGGTQSIVVLVYALRHKISLAPGFAPNMAQSQLKGNTVATGVVYSTYQRP